MTALRTVGDMVRVVGGVIGIGSAGVGGVAWLTSMHGEVKATREAVTSIAPALKGLDQRVRDLEVSTAAINSRACPDTP